MNLLLRSPQRRARQLAAGLGRSELIHRLAADEDVEVRRILLRRRDLPAEVAEQLRATALRDAARQIPPFLHLVAFSHPRAPATLVHEGSTSHKWQVQLAGEPPPNLWM